MLSFAPSVIFVTGYFRSHVSKIRNISIEYNRKNATELAVDRLMIDDAETVEIGDTKKRKK